MKISSLICYDIGNDCLDLSYSNGDISDIYASNIKDKVVSLGEKSNISILSVEAYDSEIGLVAKDQSILNINLYKFNDLKIPVSAYIKKQEYGPPSIIINNTSSNKYLNQLNFISKDSSVLINGKVVKGISDSSEVSEMFYGNIFGVKTKRWIDMNVNF